VFPEIIISVFYIIAVKFRIRSVKKNKNLRRKLETNEDTKQKERKCGSEEK